MNQVHISAASWRSRSVVGLAVALVALTVACGDDDSKGSPGTTASATTEPSATTSESTGGGDSDSEGATVLALMAAAGLEADLDAEQLACVDEVFDGVDLSEFDETFDPFGDYVSDDAMVRSGKMLDDCFESEDRIEIVAASMINAELGTAVQIACSAQQFDALVLAAGTFEDLLTMELDVSEQMFDAFEGCGIDMGETDG